MLPFDPFDIELPIIARSLCEEAYARALSLFGDADPDIVREQIANFFTAVLEHSERAGNNDTQLTEIDALYLLENAENLGFWKAALRGTTQSIAEKSGLAAQVNNATDESIRLIRGGTLVVLILVLKAEESAMIGKNTIDLDYGAIVEKLDGFIYGLHQVLVMDKTLDPAIDTMFSKWERVESAKKGGTIKHQGTNDLRETVIAEWKAKHVDKKPAQAGRDIEKFLKEKVPGWLVSEEGEPLLVNAPVRFAEWIRTEKNKKMRMKYKKKIPSA